MMVLRQLGGRGEWMRRRRRGPERHRRLRLEWLEDRRWLAFDWQSLFPTPLADGVALRSAPLGNGTARVTGSPWRAVPCRSTTRNSIVAAGALAEFKKNAAANVPATDPVTHFLISLFIQDLALGDGFPRVGFALFQSFPAPTAR